MKTTLKTDITVKDICEGFVYNELEGNPASERQYFHNHKANDLRQKREINSFCLKGRT